MPAQKLADYNDGSGSFVAERPQLFSCFHSEFSQSDCYEVAHVVVFEFLYGFAEVAFVFFALSSCLVCCWVVYVDSSGRVRTIGKDNCLSFELRFRSSSTFFFLIPFRLFFHFSLIISQR